MKKIVAVSAFLSAVLLSGMASADTDTFRLGGAIDLSAPSGLAVGIQARLPYVPWFKVGGSVSYLLSPGMRANLTFDPVNFAIGPVLNADVGHVFSFKLPGTDKSPDITFNYIDLQGGIGIGGRDHFRFLILAGMSRISLDVANFQNVVSSNGVSIGSPHVDAWIPSGKLAGTWLF